MTRKDDDRKYNLVILKALNEAIEKGPWHKSLFFQAMLKKLSEIRDRFKRDIGLKDTEESPTATKTRDQTNLIEVFVLLYNAEGSNIAKWESILNSISSHVVSRPIYRNENEAKSALRAASNKINEAFISVYIREADILNYDPDRTPLDRYGKELIVVRDGAIHREKVARFVHTSGNYEFENNKLIWQGPVEFL